MDQPMAGGGRRVEGGREGEVRAGGTGGIGAVVGGVETVHLDVAAAGGDLREGGKEGGRDGGRVGEAGGWSEKKE